MKLRIFLSSILFTVLALPGCKSSPPQIAGKWHGISPMDATLTTTLNPKPRSEKAQIDITLLLTQNAGTVQGEATIAVPKGSVYHIPIKAGVIGADGKITIDGDSDSVLTKAHFSFDGAASTGKLSGNAEFGFSNVGGKADCKGPVTFAVAS